MHKLYAHTNSSGHRYYYGETETALRKQNCILQAFRSDKPRKAFLLVICLKEGCMGCNFHDLVEGTGLLPMLKVDTNGQRA